MAGQAFNIWEDPTGVARFCFSHSDGQFTTGVMILKSNAELPKHNRPLAFENLLQVSGVSMMSLLDEDGELQNSYELRPGTALRMEKGQWHIHANPFEEESVTLFKAEGDITDVIKKLEATYTQIEPEDVTVE
jgi:quercetin dioxygenase-like cupin family protein